MTFREFLLRKLAVSGFFMEESRDSVKAWIRGWDPARASLTILNVSTIPRVLPAMVLTAKPTKAQARYLTTDAQRRAFELAERYMRGEGEFKDWKKLFFFATSLMQWVQEYLGREGEQGAL